MPDTSPAAVAPPADRYGTARPRRLPRWVGWTALGVVAVAVLAWIGARQLDHTLDWHDVGFSVQDATATSVTFEVSKPTDATASCTVQALSQSFGQVGVRTVEVGPAETRDRRVTVVVPTSELAVSGGLVGCELADD